MISSKGSIRVQARGTLPWRGGLEMAEWPLQEKLLLACEADIDTVIPLHPITYHHCQSSMIYVSIKTTLSSIVYLDHHNSHRVGCVGRVGSGEGPIWAAAGRWQIRTSRLQTPLLQCPILQFPILQCPILQCPLLQSPILQSPILQCSYTLHSTCSLLYAILLHCGQMYSPVLPYNSMQFDEMQYKMIQKMHLFKTETMNSCEVAW